MIGLDNPLHLAILFFILLLIFGAKRLPDMGRSLGTGLRNFKESVTGHEPAAELGAASASTEPAASAPAPAAAELGAASAPAPAEEVRS